MSDVVADSEFGVFKGAVAGGGVVRAIGVPGPRRHHAAVRLDELTELREAIRREGLAWLALGDDGGQLTARSPIAKFLSADELHGIARAAGAGAGDLLLLVADSAEVAANVLGRLRERFAEELKLADPNVAALCWVIDFPLFSWDAEGQRWDAVHHPFTAPLDEDVAAAGRPNQDACARRRTTSC